MKKRVTTTVPFHFMKRRLKIKTRNTRPSTRTKEQTAMKEPGLNENEPDQSQKRRKRNCVSTKSSTGQQTPANFKSVAWDGAQKYTSKKLFK